MFYKQRGTDWLVYLDYSDHLSLCNLLHILSDGDLNLVLACDTNVSMKAMTEDLGFVTIKFPWWPLKDSVIVLWPSPTPPPPSLATNWQSIFHSIPFILCWQRLIPTPFPTENHLPSRILGSHPRRKWLVPYYNCFLNQPGFQGSRKGTGGPHPTSRWKHFAFLPRLRSLQTATTICKWRGHEKHQQKQKSDQQWVLLWDREVQGLVEKNSYS